jgi:formylglycine-generating enzyme required for sulfatase activity
MYKILSYLLLISIPYNGYLSKNSKKLFEQRLKQLSLKDINGGYFFYGGYKTKQSELKFVPRFIICDHKVTNREYREMLDWCKKNKRNEDFNFLQINTKINNKTLHRYGLNENFLDIYLTSSKYDDYPIVSTTYAQKIKFIELYGLKNNLKCRLPHDYEIEFLLSSAECTNNNGDITTTQYQNFDEDFKKETDYDPSKYFNIHVFNDDRYKNKNKETLNYTPYNQYKPNKYGIYDLMGNVFEQCIDNYGSNNKDKVIKGAAFYTDYNLCKTENKFSINIKDNSPTVGFRIVVELSPEQKV